MRYAVVMSTRAPEDLARLPWALAEFLVDRILYLSDDPVNRSERATQPLARGQMLICSREHEGTEYRFTIGFDYSVDET